MSKTSDDRDAVAQESSAGVKALGNRPVRQDQAHSNAGQGAKALPARSSSLSPPPQVQYTSSA